MFGKSCKCDTRNTIRCSSFFFAKVLLSGKAGQALHEILWFYSITIKVFVVSLVATTITSCLLGVAMPPKIVVEF